MSTQDEQYQYAVEAGKSYLKKIDGYQQRICELAMTVVQIRHGGRSAKLYTIKDYATDIGMKYKTLQNWLLIYRNVIQKLPDPSKAKWNIASKTNSVLEEFNTLDNAAENTPRSKRYHKEVSKETVRDIYTKYQYDKPFEGEFVNIVQETKQNKGHLQTHIKNLNDIPEDKLRRVESSTRNAKDLLKKRALNIIPDQRLIVLMNLFDECSDLINDYLTAKPKYQ